MNRSYQTNCAEEDNVNVPLYGEVRRFRVIATHPTYTVTSYACNPDFASCTPGKVTLLYPFGAIGGDANPTYRWTDAALGTHEYRLYIQRQNGGVVFDNWISSGGNCDGATCSFSPGTALSNGAYQWWVLPRNPYGVGVWSRQGDFAVGPSATFPQVTLISPLGNIAAAGMSYNNLTYRWTDTPGATWYRLYVQNYHGQKFIDRWLQEGTVEGDNAICDGMICQVTFRPDQPNEKNLPPGAYNWWVLPWSQVAGGIWSARGDFGCDKILDDHADNAIWACYEQDWWRGRGMRVVAGNEVRDGFQQVTFYRRCPGCSTQIPGADSWPSFLVLYQDGNLRLIPHPPQGQESVCYGSSVIVGPVEVPAPINAQSRPYVDIQTVTFNPQTVPCFDITYVNGGQAHVCPTVDRSQAVANVEIAYDTVNKPFAVLRCMWVSDGNADVDHIQNYEGDFSILSNWTQLTGPWWFFHRDSWSRHNNSAPDIRIETTPAAPTLASPLGAIDTFTPIYTWVHTPGATHYRLYVQDAAGNLKHDQTYEASALCSGATCSVTPGAQLGCGAHSWWVQGINEAGGGPWSDEGQFTVVTGQVTLIYPIGEIGNDTNPTYQWTDVPGATWYRVYVQRADGVQVHDQWVEDSPRCNGTTCSDFPNVPLANGAYNWWVLTWGPCGYGTWSNRGDFQVGPGKPVLIAPVGQAFTTVAPITFTWHVVNDATAYRLYVEGPAGMVHDQTYQASAICSATCAVTPDILWQLSDGAYRWWVRASDPSGGGPWSDTGAFVLAAPAPGQATLTSPVGNIGGDANPTYRWSDVLNATWYRVYVQKADGTKIIDEWVKDNERCDGTACSFFPNTALADGAYNWWALTWGPGGYGTWSAQGDFTVAASRSAVN